jgi:hypothetical protein
MPWRGGVGIPPERDESMTSTRYHRIFAGTLLTLPLLLGHAGAEGLEPIQYTFGDGTVIRFSGQINMGILTYDDGDESYTDFVDNDNSSSRVRLVLTKPMDEWTFESTFEAEYQPLASSYVSQLNSSPDWDFYTTYIRKAEISFANDRFGRIWVGQGSMASDGVAEVDKSGTSIISYSSIADTAGGYFFRFANGGLSNVKVGNAYSNLDGLGRKVRVRYDTPTYHGFGLRASYGADLLDDKHDDLYDIAATYGNDTDLFAISGAAGFAHNTGTDTDILSASVSALHKPSGLSLTLAGGREDTRGPDGYYGYAKLGYERQFFDIGSTAFSIDYYRGVDIATADSDGDSVGLAVVQNVVDWNLQLWLLWRTHHFDDATTEYQDSQALFGGAIFRF